jgi:hypothetical protein
MAFIASDGPWLECYLQVHATEGEYWTGLIGSDWIGFDGALM